MVNTLDYYNQNAASFVDSTIAVDFTYTQEKFLSRLPDHAIVLDYGCGSGRDAKYFIEKGLFVEAMDGSEELCRLASEYTGIRVKKMYFQDLREVGKYDGIWACSSILHLDKVELKKVFEIMRKALKEKGIIYTSFKYGTYEGERNGRYFTDFTEQTFQEYLKGISGITLSEFWVTEDARPGRESERWLNLILQKV